MAFWRKNKETEPDAPSEPQWGYNAVVSLIRTRLDLPACIAAMQAEGLSEVLAARYLDLAMVLASREVLSTVENIEWPDSYAAIIEIPELPTTFAECRLAQEVAAVYAAEPTAATLLGPLASDFFAINQAMQNGAQAMRVPPAKVGDGSQVAFARATFGDDGVLKMAESWPELA